jgi:hypothetical protein
MTAAFSTPETYAEPETALPPIPPGTASTTSSIGGKVTFYANSLTGNNPVKYQDPDGREIGHVIKAIVKAVGGFWLKRAAEDAVGSIKNRINESFPQSNTETQIVDTADKNHPMPESDKDKIAAHSFKQGHGKKDLDIPTQKGIREKIDAILRDPETQVGVGLDEKTDNYKYGYLDKDGNLLIHNPSDNGNKGTIFQPNDPDEYFNSNFPYTDIGI